MLDGSIKNNGILDRRALEDCRANEDRRSSPGGVPHGEDAGSERRRSLADWRQSTDRRGWKFGLISRTTVFFLVIEDWLEVNCLGEWGLGFEEIDG